MKVWRHVDVMETLLKPKTQGNVELVPLKWLTRMGSVSVYSIFMRVSLMCVWDAQRRLMGRNVEE